MQLIRTRTLTLYSLLALSASTAARADHPFRGVTQVSVILCKFSDSPKPARSRSFFQNMFFADISPRTPGTGSLTGYWGDISNRAVSLQGSVVGWYTESFT